MNTFEGVLAHVGVETVDKRIIWSVQADPPVPVFALDEFDRKPVGVLLVVEQRGDALWGSGRVDITRGTYGVGIEMKEVTLRDTPPVDDPEYVWQFDGTLGALIVYVDDNTRPAWPDAKIEVK